VKAERAGVPELGLEVLDILWSCYVLKHHSLEPQDELDAMRRLKILQVLTNDVLLRLAKLGEANRGSWNFAQVAKRTKRGDTPRVAQQIKHYRDLIQSIAQLRNSRIAHRAQEFQAGSPPPLEMWSAVGVAVSLLDELSGERVAYHIGGIDLRNAVLGEAA
jgi:hypothetical protein